MQDQTYNTFFLGARFLTSIITTRVRWRLGMDLPYFCSGNNVKTDWSSVFSLVLVQLERGLDEIIFFVFVFIDFLVC